MADAGKIAPTYDGEWSADKTYDFHTYVTHNNNCYIAKQPSTGVEPTEEDNAYWFLALKNVSTEELSNLQKLIEAIISGTTTVGNASKLGGETSSQWQTKLDNIQTTSRGTLSQAGWYRVAEYKGSTSVQLRGRGGNSCDLTIKRWYSNNENETHFLRLLSVIDLQEFKSMGSKSKVQLITKVRYTYDSSKAYLEVYYNGTSGNEVVCNITHPKDYSTAWTKLDFIATSETVDGVTVTTTYDIPANASPVTDLDLFKTVKSYENLDFNTALETGIYCSPSTPSSAGATNYPIDGTGILEVISGKKVITQNYYCYYGTIIYSRSKFYSDSWSEWKQIATTADLTSALAGYLPKTGGNISGDLDITSSESKQMNLVLKNNAKEILLAVRADGSVSLYDRTNDKSIIASTKDGTNTFNGTASGNLALDGGGTVQKASWNPMSIKNTASNTNCMGFIGANGVLGYLGFLSADTPGFIGSSGSGGKELLHTGNSAKVAIQSSAPSDTSALWVDTANKVIKAYIDGAWTQVS